MKDLSKPISKEIWIKNNYAIAKFMNDKNEVIKTTQDQKIIFTIKAVKECNIDKQLQFHIRFNDSRFIEKILDVDIYAPLSELDNIIDGLKQIKIEAWSKFLKNTE